MKKVVLITGATSGLGRYLTEQLSLDGHTVLVHGRNAERTERLAASLPVPARPYVADLASLAAVRTLSEQIAADHPRLDVLVNNAGIGYGASGRELSADGHELRFAVNYLAPYLLTRLMLPQVRAATPSRIVNIGSRGQVSLDFDDLRMDRAYDGTTAYRRAKLALAMATFDVAEELAGTGVTVNVVHPATYMDTAMVRGGGGTPQNTVEDGGKAVLKLINDPQLADVTGTFFDGGRPARAHPDAYRPELRVQLHMATEKLLA